MMLSKSDFFFSKNINTIATEMISQKFFVPIFDLLNQA